MEKEQFITILTELSNEVLSNPESAALPDNEPLLLALAGIMAIQANDLNFQKIIAYAERLPKDWMVMVITQCIRQKSIDTCSRVFIDWATKYQTYVFSNQTRFF